MGKLSFLMICWPISISLILLCSPVANAVDEPTYIYHFCSNQSTYAAFSPFHNNLNRLLLQRLYIEGSISMYFNTTVGAMPDKAYGLFLCREDVSPGVCQNCIDKASSVIIWTCPGNRSAIIWYDQCLVRYTDRNFFNVLEMRPAVRLINTANVTDPEKFNQTLGETFEKLMNEVISDPSRKMYGTANITVSSSWNLYVLIQCLPELSVRDCSICLMSAYDVLPHGRRGARTLMPSCNIRYETYPFFNQSGGRVAAPGPSSNPSNNRSRTDTTIPGSPSSPNQNGSESRRAWFIIVGSIGSTLFVLSLIGCLIWFMRRRKPKKGEETSQELQLLNLRRQVKEEFPNEDQFHEKPVISHELAIMQLEVIRAATKDFSTENKLGEGGFGSVYKGILEDGKEIAVKRLSRSSSQGLSELRTELTLIARLQHRNLVRLLGCCLENDEKLVIYEYMPNKSLDFFLFGSSSAVILDWRRRLSIINGVARGLLYLHEDSRLRIIHRDLKASNILLDHDMNPKISDFGMARIVGGNQTGDNTNRVVGTYGYMAPEYAMEGLFSIKSDVFSFGVLLLELLSGKRNNGFHLHQHGQSLLTYAWNLWGEGRALELIDPLMIESIDAVQALKCIHIGLLCVQEEPADRPTVSLVVLMLGGETTSLPQPTQPAFSVGRDAPALDEPGPDNNVVWSANELTLSNASPR